MMNYMSMQTFNLVALRNGDLPSLMTAAKGGTIDPDTDFMQVRLDTRGMSLADAKDTLTWMTSNVIGQLEEAWSKRPAEGDE